MRREDSPRSNESSSGFPRYRPAEVGGDPSRPEVPLVDGLADLCESILLAPLDSPGTDRLAALEPRVDRPLAPRPPTAAYVADELVRRLRAQPDLRARVIAQLQAPDAQRPASARPALSELGDAEFELRQAHRLLDDLGCPRSSDDRNLRLLERLRWLMDVVASGRRANASGFPIGLNDTTPATGSHVLPPIERSGDTAH